MPSHSIPLSLFAAAERVVCCDGAYVKAIALGRKPDLVVGDGDSLDDAQKAALGERFVHVAEQETNDLAKAFCVAVARFGVFTVATNTRTYESTPGDAVSVFAPSHGTQATSVGLEWPLNGVPLDSLWRGTLNRATGAEFTISSNRPLIVYLPHSVVRGS